MAKKTNDKISARSAPTNKPPINRLFALAIEERLDAAKYRAHRRSLRMLHTLLILPELLDEPSLLLRDGLGDVHVKRDDLIAHHSALHSLHALAAQTHLRVALRARRHLHVHRAAQRGHRHRAAQNGRGHGDGDAAVHVVAAAVEERVGLNLRLIRGTRTHVHVDVQIAVARAMTALVALAQQTHRVARVDSRGDLHRQGGAVPHLCVSSAQKAHRAAAVALRARVRVDVARAAALGTGRHRHHDAAVILPIRHAANTHINHALAATPRARLSLVVRTLRITLSHCHYEAAAMASIALDIAIIPKITLASLDAVQERDRHVHRNVGAPVVRLTSIASETIKSSETAIASRFSAKDISKMPQQLVHVHVSLLEPGALILHARVAKLVVTSTLVVVLQDFVSLAHLNELLLRILIPLPITPPNHSYLIRIRVVLLGQLKVSLLYVCFGSILWNAQNLFLTPSNRLSLRNNRVYRMRQCYGSRARKRLASTRKPSNAQSYARDCVCSTNRRNARQYHLGSRNGVRQAGLRTPRDQANTSAIQSKHYSVFRREMFEKRRNSSGFHLLPVSPRSEYAMRLKRMEQKNRGGEKSRTSSEWSRCSVIYCY